MVAPAGATPCAHSTRGVGSAAVAKIAGMSPPGPTRCGSTTCSTKPAATAASNALPPDSSTAMPAAEASQWVDAPMPTVPVSSGRVVNMTPSDHGGEFLAQVQVSAADTPPGQAVPAQRVRVQVVSGVHDHRAGG